MLSLQSVAVLTDTNNEIQTEIIHSFYLCYQYFFVLAILKAFAIFLLLRLIKYTIN